MTDFAILPMIENPIFKNALDRLEKNSKTIKFEYAEYPRYVDIDNPGPNLTRVDWELSDAAHEDLEREEESLSEALARLIIAQMETDFADILVNGDKDSSDPALKIMDGSEKLGKELVGLHFIPRRYFKAPMPKKATTEYTLYINIIPEWK